MSRPWHNNPSWKTERLPAQICPVCGSDNDAGSYYEDGEPLQPGDVSICWTCGHIAILATDFGLREPTAVEADELADDPAVAEVKRVRLAALMSKARGR